ncbi:quinolinate synthase NadA, partial [Paenibacillus xylanexedens]|uniref:quinolinate synthase NadA n=1 Tax=Paenibacillus xylanexedens TaxID=528191 RepID=UPI001642D3D7
WLPHKNLGHYLHQHTDNKMIIWEGYSNTHHILTLKHLLHMTPKYPNPQFLVHPQSPPEVLHMRHFLPTTTPILQYCK